MPAPPTRPTLIQRIRDPDDVRAWEEFVEIYTPILYHFAVSKGLQAADASDITQDVMHKVSKAMERFEHREGVKFRSWLYQIARRELSNFFRRKSRRPQEDGRTTAMIVAEAQVDKSAEEEHWDRDYREQIFKWAVSVVKPQFTPRIWDAFWRSAMNEENIRDIAADLQMTPGAVYVAKSRCIKQLQEKISETGDSWEQKLG